MRIAWAVGERPWPNPGIGTTVRARLIRKTDAALSDLVVVDQDGNPVEITPAGIPDHYRPYLTEEKVEYAPGFSPGMKRYTATVANAVNSIIVTATPARADAAVEYVRSIDVDRADEDTQTPELEASLMIGENRVRVKVTQGSETATYVITVTRKPTDEKNGSGNEPEEEPAVETPVQRRGGDALRVRFESVPEWHDGKSEFALRLAFSEEVRIDRAQMRTGAVTISGGVVSGAVRVKSKEDGDLWELTVQPESTEAVTLSVDAGRPCKEAGAICTNEGKQLSEGAQVTVRGPTKVTVGAVTSPVNEGEEAVFELERERVTTSELTVSVTVSEAGAVVSETLPEEVTFAAESTTARLTVATEDNEQGEADARVTVTVSEGIGYVAPGGAGTAWVDVFDDDPVAVAKRTVWTAQLTVSEVGSGLGFVDSDNLVPDEWTEEEQEYGAESLHYVGEQEELSLGVTDELPASDELSLYLDERVLRLSDAVYREGAYSWASVSGLQWEVGQEVAVKLERVPALPGMTVADASVNEVAGASLRFEVTLGSQHSEAVTVRYATSDDTATAGADYEAASGVVRFEAGETVHTVAVSVLNDEHDEGTETLNLSLSRPYGAELADGEAVGSIVNSDPLPRAWVSRFGHTVAAHVLDAVEARLRGGGGTQVTLGGHRLQRAQETASASVTENDAAFEQIWLEPQLQTIGLRELVSGSSFGVSDLGGAEGGTGGGRWTLWGRADWSGFAGREGAVAVNGDVLTGTVGTDWEQDGWLLGMALAYSVGSGGYRGAGAGEAESRLASVHPYARVALHERLELWGVLGYGLLGELRLSNPEVKTDLGMAMGALGLRGTLLQRAQTGGLELTGKADGLLLRMDTGAVPNLAATEATVERWRLLLEASFGALPLLGGTLTPTVEVGGRYDRGDAENGAGVVVGGNLSYGAPGLGLTLLASGRGLLEPQTWRFREWGVGGSLLLDPGVPGRGLAVRVAPEWGGQGTSAAGLWGVPDMTALPGGDQLVASGRLSAELSYGFAGGASYAGMTAAGGGERTWRLGGRAQVTDSFELSLEGTRRELAHELNPDVYALTISGTYRG